MKQKWAVVILAAALSGCAFRRAHVPPPPPGPLPVRIPDQVTSRDPAPAPVNLPAPPAVEPVPADRKLSTAKAVGLKTAPTAEPPKAVKRRRGGAVAKAKPMEPAPTPMEETSPPEAPVYRLGELRSAEERERLRQQTEQFLGVCQAALTAAQKRGLSAAQAEMVNRIRLFSEEARQALEKDPGEARGFALKGKTFAEALLAELQ